MMFLTDLDLAWTGARFSKLIWTRGSFAWITNQKESAEPSPEFRCPHRSTTIGVAVEARNGLNELWSYYFKSMVLLYMVCHGSHEYTPFMLALIYQHHGSVMGMTLSPRWKDFGRSNATNWEKKSESDFNFLKQEHAQQIEWSKVIQSTKFGFWHA